MKPLILYIVVGLLITLAILVGLAMWPSAARAEGISIAAQANDLICEYAGTSSQDCQIARDDTKTQWFHHASIIGPRSGLRGEFVPQTMMIWLSADVFQPTTVADFKIHEISHLKDFLSGRCCTKNTCMDTERRAYEVQVAFWQWVTKVHGPQALAWQYDSDTQMMNRALEDPDAWIWAKMEEKRTGQCLNWR